MRFLGGKWRKKIMVPINSIECENYSVWLFACTEGGQTTSYSNGKGGVVGGRPTVPPIATGALVAGVGEQATTTAKANAGVLRFAQNDKGFELRGGFSGETRVFGL